MLNDLDEQIGGLLGWVKHEAGAEAPVMGDLKSLYAPLLLVHPLWTRGYVDGVWVEGMEHRAGSLPPFSTDIAAAFEVVETMRERGWEFDLGSRAGNEQWRAEFATPVQSDPASGFYQDYLQIPGYGDTPARAIVEAALAALLEARV